MTDSLIFVIHRRMGRESPALYHGELPPVHDPIVYRVEITEQRPLSELFSMYLDLRDIGALPSKAWPAAGII